MDRLSRSLKLTRSLKVQNDSKIVLLVADGLGGLPMKPGHLTELEAAKTPHLDMLAKRGVLGSTIPVKPGISPGSGPGHLALFGYDPLHYVIGRGALEATGIGFDLAAGDVAARCNFCTLDASGNIRDRRAGRIPTEASTSLVNRLRNIKIPQVELFVEPVKEHRFVVIFRGESLGDAVRDTDPQATGVPPLPPQPVDATGRHTSQVAEVFISEAQNLLSDQAAANGLTMRGFSARPELPTYEEVYGLKAAAIAVYPMYKGLARLVGMQIVAQPQTLAEQIELLRQQWKTYDFFFVHYKYTDSTGEDGDFPAKVARIEELDNAIPELVDLKPTVIIVTGDHSTPSRLRRHSWHPVPTLLVSDICRSDDCTAFGERECLHGGLGLFEAEHLMPLALANADRLAKYGA